ncbi:MAG: diacylglycerol/lipid kinase family protein, partial [Armatimonadota bacterium]
MHIVIIANPTSARGRGRKRKQELITLLEQAIDLAEQQTNATHTYEIIETTAPGFSIKTNQKNPGSAAYLAHQAATNPQVKADIVAAAGGDGTIGEVANGLIGTNTPLGVLPMGTGNDFARTIGINTDLALAFQTLFHGTAKPVDLGKIENGGYFLNIAGCGYDAEVAARINHGFKRLK